MSIKTWGLAALIAASLTACANEERNDQGGGGGEPTQQVANQSQNVANRTADGAGGARASAADKQFIDMMTPHHEMGVMMAEDALKNAKHPELRAFAQKTASDQRHEIAEMKAHRRHLFGAAETPPMDHGQMSHVAAGPNFDVQWAQSMIQHHQQAIDQSRKTLEEARSPEVKQMARKVIDKQTREQAQLRRLVAAWSGK